MKGLLRFVAVAAAMAMFAGTAKAGFTAGPFAGNSAAAAGNAGNTINNYNHAGPDFVPGTVTFEGDLTRVISGDFLSENRIRICNPTLQCANFQLSTTSSYSGTVHVGPVTINTGGFYTNSSIGNWTFEMFNSADDGSGPDATWANLNITVNDFVPPTPPANTIDLGLLGSNQGDMLMNLQTWSAPTVQWYKFTLGNAIGGGNGLILDTFGTSLSATQFGANDTHMALFNAAGNVVNVNDDHTVSPTTYRESKLLYGNGGPSQPTAAAGTLAAGVYYVAVSPYQLSTSAGFNATYTAQTPPATGDIKLNITYIPEPGTIALLGFAALALIRRRA